MVAPGRWVVLAGSLPAGGSGHDLPASGHARRVSAAGTWPLTPAGRLCAKRLPPEPDLVKPNREELEELSGRPLPDHAALTDAAADLARAGVGTVIVSLGADGALFTRDGDAAFAAAPPVRVASTVGAGDAMVAGTIAGILRALGLAETAALATAFSAVAITPDRPPSRSFCGRGDGPGRLGRGCNARSSREEDTAMRFVAVTACPTGIAHTLMAAEALKRQAQLMGHQIDIETQGAEGTLHPLDPDAIARADAVIFAADIYVDPTRFAGKPVSAAATADAIRHPHDVIEAAAAATAEPDVALPESEPETQPPPTPAAGAGQKRIIAITSCPTGIAHTFMAAEGLRKAAEGMGHWIKVETQGSVGAKNLLTAEDVAAADAVVIAADTRVDLSRFVGKPLYQTGTKEALKHGDEVLNAALGPSTTVFQGGDGRARRRRGSGPCG